MGPISPILALRKPSRYRKGAANRGGRNDTSRRKTCYNEGDAPLLSPSRIYHLLSEHQGPPPVSSREPARTPREVLALCREKDVKAVDLRFTDLLGTSQHFTIPVGKLDEGVFDDGRMRTFAVNRTSRAA